MEHTTTTTMSRAFVAVQYHQSKEQGGKSSCTVAHSRHFYIAMHVHQLQKGAASTHIQQHGLLTGIDFKEFGLASSISQQPPQNRVQKYNVATIAHASTAK
jgi:hypothetical protein